MASCVAVYHREFYSTLFIYLRAVKWFLLLISNINNIGHFLVHSEEVQVLLTLFYSNILKWFHILLFITDNCIQYYSFICTQLILISDIIQCFIFSMYTKENKSKTGL